jgi:hypothetical protein
MQTANRSSFQLSIITLTLVAFFALGIPMWGQEAPAITVGDVRITGLVDDWSHHHLVFSNPGTADEAIKNGTYEQWLKITKDPRYIMHQLKRGLPAQGLASEAVAMRASQAVAIASMQAPRGPQAPSTKPATVKKDWSMGLGGYLGAGQYPAKYNFSTTTASCSDYVVYPTGLAGSATQATVVAYDNIYNNTTCAALGSVPSINWAYNTGGTSKLSPILSFDGTQVAYIQLNTSNQASLVLLKPGPNATGRTVAGSLSASSPNVTITSGTFTSTDVGAQITGTGIGSGDTIASVLSSTTANLATAPTAHTSETLTIVAETAAAPGVPTSVTNGSYRGCTAPCYTTIGLNGNPNDTNSSPFYIYGGGLDTMYVGDNSGKLHQFTGVFYGTPAENTTTGGWPVTVSANILTSPVYDFVSTLVFVGDSGGYLYSLTTTGSSSQTKTASADLTVTGSTGIVDAPLLDSMPATPEVYVFAGDTDAVYQFATNFASSSGGIQEAVGSSATTTKVYAGAFDNLHYDIAGGAGGNLYVCGAHSTGTTPRLYKIVMNSTFTGAVSNTTTDPAGGAATCSPVTEFLGSKANTTLGAAITSTTATSITVASITGIANGDYLQVDSEIMLVTAAPSGSTVTVARGQLGTAAATHLNAAAVQDIQDWIFLSVTANGTGNGCTGACLYNYSVTTGAVPANATTGLAATGGTSGIIIDNSSTTAGASQIYYTTLGSSTCAGNGTTGATTGGCAIQASQSAP